MSTEQKRPSAAVETVTIQLNLSKNPPVFDPEDTNCRSGDQVDFTTSNGATETVTITDKSTKIPVNLVIPGAWSAVTGDYNIKYEYKGGTVNGTINVIVGM